MLQVVLDKESRSKLLSRFGRKHTGRVTAHHVTVAFKPTEGEMRAFPVGKEVDVKVIGHGFDNRGQAVVVEVDGVSVKNAVPHVTVSVAEGTKPVYSNTLLSEGYDRVEPFVLKGVCTAVTFKQENVTSDMGGSGEAE